MLGESKGKMIFESGKYDPLRAIAKPLTTESGCAMFDRANCTATC